MAPLGISLDWKKNEWQIFSNEKMKYQMTPFNYNQGLTCNNEIANIYAVKSAQSLQNTYYSLSERQLKLKIIVEPVHTWHTLPPPLTDSLGFSLTHLFTH